MQSSPTAALPASAQGMQGYHDISIRAIILPLMLRELGCSCSGRLSEYRRNPASHPAARIFSRGIQVRRGLDSICPSRPSRQVLIVVFPISSVQDIITALQRGNTSLVGLAAAAVCHLSHQERYRLRFVDLGPQRALARRGSWLSHPNPMICAGRHSAYHLAHLL